MARAWRIINKKRRHGKRCHLLHILLCSFFVAWLFFAYTFWQKNRTASLVAVLDAASSHRTVDQHNMIQQHDLADRPTPRLLSTPQNTRVSTDVRGNLGPASVLLNNGTDWLKDRWQAASDMHGTAISGSHWVQLDFVGHNQDRTTSYPLYHVTRIVLDWETAYSNDYTIQGIGMTRSSSDAASVEAPETVLLYDTHQQQQTTASEERQSARLVSVREYGQSPGVKQKLPLHVIHTIDMSDVGNDSKQQQRRGIQSLRIVIRKPFHPGWGVSLWTVQVYGYMLDEYEIKE